MTGLFSLWVIGLGIGRVLLGLAPFVAAGPSARLLGFPRSEDTPTARLMGRLFGVRDVGLGVLAFASVLHPAAAPFVFLFNAAMDAGDVVATSIPLVKREGIDRAAIRSMAFAVVGGLAWVVTFAVWTG